MDIDGMIAIVTNPGRNGETIRDGVIHMAPR